MFMGEYNHTLDTKGRVFIPAKFRDELGSSFVLSAGFDGCLYICPSAYYETFAMKLAGLPFSENSRKIQRFFLRNADTCEIDKQGRIVIPPRLKELAGLTKDVVFVGATQKIELWDKDKLENGCFDESIDEIAEEVSAKYGISF